MNIKHNNSLYCEIPPATIAEQTITPSEMFEDAVAQHIDEENYFQSYFDMEEIRVCELIENGKNQRA